MRSLAHPAREDEQMDAADLDPATYARILDDLAQVNRWTFAARPTLVFIGRAVKGRDRFSLLDVGYGDGDLLRTIARWAARRGIHADLTGIDINPNSVAVARAATPEDMPIDYRTGDYRSLVEGAESGGFDLIVSSLVAHHMNPEELQAFLRTMEAHAQIGWHINDLHRHRFAYLGYPLLARLMGWHRIVREDGQLSIARAFRPAEWAPALTQAGVGNAARVVRYFPFRLCVERLR